MVGARNYYSMQNLEQPMGTSMFCSLLTHTLIIPTFPSPSIFLLTFFLSLNWTNVLRVIMYDFYFQGGKVISVHVHSSHYRKSMSGWALFVCLCAFKSIWNLIWVWTFLKLWWKFKFFYAFIIYLLLFWNQYRCRKCSICSYAQRSIFLSIKAMMW